MAGVIPLPPIGGSGTFTVAPNGDRFGTATVPNAQIVLSNGESLSVVVDLEYSPITMAFLKNNMHPLSGTLSITVSTYEGRNLTGQNSVTIPAVVPYPLDGTGASRLYSQGVPYQGKFFNFVDIATSAPSDFNHSFGFNDQTQELTLPNVTISVNNVLRAIQPYKQLVGYSYNTIIIAR